MGVVRSVAVKRGLETLWGVGVVGETDDNALIARFLSRTGAVSDPAFRVLVERHGAMVERTCRQILGDCHDAQDASQAVFLVLAMKAGGIRDRGSIAPWLHGVACRVARKARVRAAVRRTNEANSARTAATPRGGRDESTPVDLQWDAIHEEVGRLPEKYRVPIVLCYLEGLTYEDASRRIGCPLGTIRVRLSRARDRLREGLRRRGFGPSAVASSLPGWLAEGQILPLSAPAMAWVETTTRAVHALVSGHATEAGAVSASALTLSREVLFMLWISKLKMLAMGGFLVLGVTIGTGSILGQVFYANQTPAGISSTSQAVDASKGKPAISDSVKDPERELIQKLVDTSNRRLETQRAFYEESRIKIDRYIDASEQLMSGELQLARKRSQRVIAVAKHLKRIANMEDRERFELTEGRGTEADVVEVQQAREKAELELLRVSNSDVPDVRVLEKRIEVLEGKLDRALKAMEGKGVLSNDRPTH